MNFYQNSCVICTHVCTYRGADKSLARPGREQATSTKLFNFCKPLKKNSEGCPSNQVYAAAMTSMSDEKWRPFNCFFSRVGLRTYQHPCTLSLISALDGDGWSTPRPGRFPPRKTRYPLYRRPGGPQGWSGCVRKISLQQGLDPRTAQHAASGYTD